MRKKKYTIKVQGHITSCEICHFQWDLEWMDDPGNIGRMVIDHLRKVHGAPQHPPIEMVNEYYDVIRRINMEEK